MLTMTIILFIETQKRKLPVVIQEKANMIKYHQNMREKMLQWKLNIGKTTNWHSEIRY